MGFTKFERFFRAAGGVTVDRDDVQRYLDFVNDVLYDLLLIGQARAAEPSLRRGQARTTRLMDVTVSPGGKRGA
jgi:hypothetical protein